MTTGLLIALVIVFGAYIYKFPPKKTLTSPNSNKICMDYSGENMNELSVDLIHTMVKGYQSNQLDYINTCSRFLPKEDAHSIWFELETLKKFIYHIEKTTLNKATTVKELKSMNITKEKLGIRIYYAAYPDRENWKKHTDLDVFIGDDEKEQYGNLHTVVMIPTLDINGSGEMYDFNPLDPITYSGGLFDRPGYTFNTNTNTKTSALSGIVERSNTNSNLSTGAQNHGSLIPPATSNGVEGF
ncbi:hypothetical protein [Flavobacterium sp. HNIBRBA15423]|uniref:hypothetical protein n=1 Tax=Flavobacterium sp. HNIBRBA15423 TaxID=3458683 RepID=UPI0040444FD8